jgi:signal transduction histidine kinase
MTLARRNVIASLAAAAPIAVVLFLAAGWLQSYERRVDLQRVAEAHLAPILRDACESDPQWFIAGARTSRPRPEDRQMPDADVRLPRPSAEEFPFEFFPFDDQFVGTTVAAPRFPDDFKRAMRTSPPARMMSGEYTGRAGTGQQVAVLTGWTPGPCAALLFRQQPVPGHAVRQTALFVLMYALAFGTVWVSLLPTSRRIRALSLLAKQSARQDYAEVVELRGNDEIGSLRSVFNDAAADIRRKAVDAREREDALRRYVEQATDDVAAPMGDLESQLSGLVGRSGLSGDDDGRLRRAVKEAHRLKMRLDNLAAVTRLRGITDTTPREAVDLSAVVARVVAGRDALARAAGVAVECPPPPAGITVQADTLLLEQAIGNLLDNAIVYNRPGGRVRVDLTAYEHGQRFRLVVADDGPGVSDEEFAALTANKRFRGDEARTRREGGRGLGLALAREVADRFGLQLDLRQPTSGGLEAEISPRRAL